MKSLVVAICRVVGWAVVVCTLLAEVLSADSVTYSSEVINSLDSALSGGLVCVDNYNCEPTDFSVPEFDPSLGTLDLVQWSFNGLQQVIIDIDNCGPTEPITYSYEITGGDMLSGPTGSSTGSATNSGGTSEAGYYGSCAIISGPGFLNSFQVQGTVLNLTDFIGTGEITVQATPFFNGSVDVIPFKGYAILSYEMDDTLSVTYNYNNVPPIPTPEPSYLLPLMVAVVVFVVCSRRGFANKKT